MLGFSILFIVLGTSIGIVGGPLLRIPEARQIAGILVIVLGMITTGVFGPVLDRFCIGVDPTWLPAARTRRAAALAPSWRSAGRRASARSSARSSRWAPRAVLAPAVALLLTAYSVGLAIPFLVAALAFPRLRPLVDCLRRHHRGVQVVTGLLIVAIGVLIYFNAFARLADLFTFAL